jgi:hypothetical protein
MQFTFSLFNKVYALEKTSIPAAERRLKLRQLKNKII